MEIIKQFFSDVLKMEMPTEDEREATQAKKNRIQAEAKANTEASRKAQAESLAAVKTALDIYNEC